jgi:thioredoxin-like negative regulator of GroEL
MRPPTVVLYARPDCHLCDEVRAQLEELRAEGLAFRLEEMNIDSDDRLLARYLERIPVVAFDGQIVSELGLDSGELRVRLDTVSG